jgi:hypothetical protein
MKKHEQKWKCGTKKIEGHCGKQGECKEREPESGDEREKKINIKRRRENKTKIVLPAFLNIWHR